MIDDLGTRMTRLRVLKAEQEDDARIAAGRARREAALKDNHRPRKTVIYYLGKLARREVEL